MSRTQHIPDNSAEMLSYTENYRKITSDTSHGSVHHSWLLFDFSWSSESCVKPHIALAHLASLPSTPWWQQGNEHLQSYHTANTTALSKYSGLVTPPCHHTELSALLRFCCKSYSSYSCQVPVAGNWEICENMGCVPKHCFCRALVYCSTVRRVPGRLNYPSSSPGC